MVTSLIMIYYNFQEQRKESQFLHPDRLSRCSTRCLHVLSDCFIPKHISGKHTKIIQEYLVFLHLYKKCGPSFKSLFLLVFRYIEGLTSDKATMCDWNKQLNSSKENTRTDEAKLPAHWLADNGEHATSLDALWALRDFMVQDSLGVVKVLNYSSL